MIRGQIDKGDAGHTKIVGAMLDLKVVHGFTLINPCHP
jgi:hypothetical protein